MPHIVLKLHTLRTDRVVKKREGLDLHVSVMHHQPSSTPLTWETSLSELHLDADAEEDVAQVAQALAAAPAAQRGAHCHSVALLHQDLC